ncbi:hypothetical protein BY458DRAFT_500890 [Sporodiniella umbellata]|nr:hypothetical protein BY458DRAFT_500890 [Sporodiniella umbellata]
MFCVQLALFVFLLISFSLAGPSDGWKTSARQFRMQIYSRPFSKGSVQHLRTYFEPSSPRPCWNIASKRVGSFALNDPLVKVTFYRSSNCQGTPSATFKHPDLAENHVLVKANSVSIIKIKPVLLKSAERRDLEL